MRRAPHRNVGSPPALCAAVLCVPALAAASATGAGAYVPNPQYTVISGTVAHQKDGGLLMSTSTGEPTEDYILWTGGVMILDAVSGESVDAKSIKGGSAPKPVEKAEEEESPEQAENTRKNVQADIDITVDDDE